MAIILAVDDDPNIIVMLKTYLEGEGHDVVTAMDAIGALQYAQSRKPQLIILDYEMPAGSGVAVVHRIRNIHPLENVPSSS